MLKQFRDQVHKCTANCFCVLPCATIKMPETGISCKNTKKHEVHERNSDRTDKLDHSVWGSNKTDVLCSATMNGIDLQSCFVRFSAECGVLQKNSGGHPKRTHTHTHTSKFMYRVHGCFCSTRNKKKRFLGRELLHLMWAVFQFSFQVDFVFCLFCCKETLFAQKQSDKRRLKRDTNPKKDVFVHNN